MWIISVTIPRHVRSLSLFYFSVYQSLSPISFETDSELTRIELYAFLSCSSFKQSQFLVMSEFVVQNVCDIVSHFHRFHLKAILN
jgi:hypothetical protein